jgi:hypothetical protein
MQMGFSLQSAHFELFYHLSAVWCEGGASKGRLSGLDTTLGQILWRSLSFPICSGKSCCVRTRKDSAYHHPGTCFPSMAPVGP